MLDVGQVIPIFVCVGTQRVDKYVNLLKTSCLCILSTYNFHLSTLCIPINCTFATENL